MTTKRMENWDAGDFARDFLRAAESSPDRAFKAEFTELGRTLSELDSEFCRETVGCGKRLSSAMEELQSIAGRMGYCSRPRGFETDCSALYGQVRETVGHLEALRERCFL